jgi:hypothetical protein
MFGGQEFALRHWAHKVPGAVQRFHRVDTIEAVAIEPMKFPGDEVEMLHGQSGVYMAVRR